MQEIIKTLPANAAAGSAEQKVHDFYESYLDVGAIDKLGLEPARPAYPVEVSRELREAGERVTARLREEHPDIDIAVLNAGTILRKPALDHPDEYWDQVLETNLTAPWMLARRNLSLTVGSLMG